MPAISCTDRFLPIRSDLQPESQSILSFEDKTQYVNMSTDNKDFLAFSCRAPSAVRLGFIWPSHLILKRYVSYTLYVNIGNLSSCLTYSWFVSYEIIGNVTISDLYSITFIYISVNVNT